MPPEWLYGVALSLVGNILINLGANVMKLGHTHMARERGRGGLDLPTYKNRSLLLGLLLYTAGNFASFFSFGYAAQSILAAIGCIQFVSNMVFASIVLKEQVTLHIACATLLILAGCVLLVVFGSHSSDIASVAQLLELFANPHYLAYLSAGTGLVMATYAAYLLGQRHARSRPDARTGHSHWQAVLPVLYSVFSALVCTQSLVFNKILMVLWRTTMAGDNQFNKWFTWLFIAGFLATAGFWVVQLNKGLRLFPALVILPSLQLCWTLFGVISGLTFFKEYVGMSALQQAMFALGGALVCGGAYALARAPQHAPAHSTKQQQLDAAQHGASVRASSEGRVGPSPGTCTHVLQDGLARKQALHGMVIVVDSSTVAAAGALPGGAAGGQSARVCAATGLAGVQGLSSAGARLRRTSSAAISWKLGTLLVSEPAGAAPSAGLSHSAHACDGLAGSACLEHPHPAGAGVLPLLSPVDGGHGQVLQLAKLSPCASDCMMPVASICQGAHAAGP